MQEQMRLAGYTVHSHRSHVGQAWAWYSPISAATHFKSEAAAWENARGAFARELKRARDLRDLGLLDG